MSRKAAAPKVVKPVPPSLMRPGDVLIRVIEPSWTPVRVRRAFWQPMVEVSFPDKSDTLWVPASELYPASVEAERDYWRRYALAIEKAAR